VSDRNSRVNAIIFVKAYPFLSRERSTSPMKPSPLWTMAVNNLLKGGGVCMRIASVAAAMCLCIVSIAAADDARAAIRKTTNIPAEGLGPALTMLAKEFDFQVLYRTETVGALRTDGVSGAVTAAEALDRVLNGTGLTYWYLDDKTVTIIPAGSVAPREEGTAPLVAGDDPNGAGSAAQEGKKGSSGEFRVAQMDQGTNSQPATVDNRTSNSQESLQKTQLTEIVVTAEKRSERLQDVPVPVTVIDAQLLVASNQPRLQDYYTRIPGLTVAPEASSPFQLISIRGLTTGVATNPTVGITVDDVPYGSSTNLGGGPAVPDFDPADLAQLEVLRGPQGTLYGASSMGGLLKFVTVDPSTESLSGRVEAGVNSVYSGAEPGYNFRASVNVPLSDSWAIRASGFTRQDPGYIDNVQTGEQGVNKTVVSGGRVSALWKPLDNFSLKLSALIQHVKGDGASDVDLPTAGYPQTIGLGDLRQSYLRGTGGYDKEFQAYSATLTAKVGSIDITSVSGYNRNTFSDSFDYTYGFSSFAQQVFEVSGVPVIITNATDKFTQEVRLSSSIGSRFEWLLGGFYTHERSSYVEDILAADSTTGHTTGSLASINQPTTYAEYAGFADLTFHITERFDIQIGGRESEIRQTSNETDAGAYVTFYEQPFTSPHVFPEVDSSANAFTYLMTPRFKVTPDIMLYARLASGYRAGGPNFNPGGIVPTQFKPDKTQNYELGLKGDFIDNKLLVDASLYYIEWKDIQLSLTNPQTYAGYNANAGRAKSQGIELSIESKPVKDLTLSAWIAVSDAELTQDLPPASQGGSAFGLSGDRLPYASRFSGSLSLQKDFPLGPELTGFAAGAVSYVGDRLGEFPSVYSPPERQIYPGYAKTDLRAGTTYKSWTATFFVNNVADKRGLLSGGLNAFPSFAFNIIQPRTVGLSVTTTF
jgi:iron complex outermembrane receptor protein